MTGIISCRAVGKNFEYVIEAVRAEGTSPWFACAHDEFALCMDGRIEVHLVKLADPGGAVKTDARGAVRLPGNPDGRKMGRVVLGREMLQEQMPLYLDFFGLSRKDSSCCNPG